MVALGYSAAEVARIFKIQHSAQITALVRRNEAQAFLQKIHEENAATITSVQTEIQIYAPKAMQNMVDALDSGDKLLRFKASVWVLEAAGHTPLRRLQISKGRDEEDIGAMGIEELRARALEAITGQRAVPAIETTAVPAKEEMN